MAGEADLVVGESEEEGGGGDDGFWFRDGYDEVAGTEAIAETTDLKTISYET